jgi:type II secretory ATPase GspE/PulE/Tfp pilus assembly ATPase PilB-like protein
VLRQDLNVVMTARSAIRKPPRSACVRAHGMLVLSTLHANDAAAAFDVFRDFGPADA